MQSSHAEVRQVVQTIQVVQTGQVVTLYSAPFCNIVSQQYSIAVTEKVQINRLQWGMMEDQNYTNLWEDCSVVC